ncbi:MAG: shikimate kinase [Prevotellaceae bacterium]|jgi:shikimate kinase|nr:shikimate kinase [Prevotellaceae bacterium]
MISTHHISLVGFMGSGKSTVGKALARILQRPLFDTDSLIETRKEKSVAEIFTAEGEAKFREYERQLLLELVNAPQPSVIVCGGGTPCFAGVMDILNAHTATFYLYTPVDILYARLKNEAAQRPLLQGKEDLQKFIETLLAQRELFYKQAKFIINTAGKTAKEIAEEAATASA